MVFVYRKGGELKEYRDVPDSEKAIVEEMSLNGTKADDYVVINGAKMYVNVRSRTVIDGVTIR